MNSFFQNLYCAFILNRDVCVLSSVVFYKEKGKFAAFGKDQLTQMEGSGFLFCFRRNVPIQMCGQIIFMFLYSENAF